MSNGKYSQATAWPDLPFTECSDTADTLHMWTQIIGKIRLSQTPWTNHSWHVPLYVTARGLGTSLIPYHAVQSSPSPDDMLLEFLQATYESAADLGRWNRSALERELVPKQTSQ